MDGPVRQRGSVYDALRRIALIAWTVAVCAICIRVSVQTRHKQSSYHDYYDAGLHWRQHSHLYGLPKDHDLSRSFGGQSAARAGTTSPGAASVIRR